MFHPVRHHPLWWMHCLKELRNKQRLVLSSCIKKNLTRCTVLTAAVLLWNKNKNNNSNNTLNFSQITFINFNTSLLFNVYNMLARMVINLPSQAIPWIVNGDLLSSTNDFWRLKVSLRAAYRFIDNHCTFISSCVFFSNQDNILCYLTSGSESFNWHS